VEFYQVKLTEALITSVQTSGSVGDDNRPAESISISFQKIEWTYQRVSNGQAVGSPVKGSYDRATGTVN
jgi:type VI protein secretion system component Hcp